MKQLITEIEELVAEVPRQCGLTASTTRSFGENGYQSLQVQIRLVPLGVEPTDEDWLFLHASEEHHFPGLRDRLAQFIAEHRSKEAA
ncbi:hypothetical protein TW86_14105 [Halomonas sp. S2151]|uniref:hypothetical protein n=1 Tax=Halomonas sp. S2151 TaxID=579478 RepID=UPI0005FA8ED3|nr:hypothetical protein [Halomonas sp. S2151]KJZ10427.1 hypothetical protein TW86_14105 [Halomonas sp. S2151]